LERERPADFVWAWLDGAPDTWGQQRRALAATHEATVHLLDPGAAAQPGLAFGWRGRRLPDPDTAVKVLLVAHRHALAMLGGGEAAWIETLIHLVGQNVHADLSLTPRFAGETHELVHLFSLRFGDQTEALQACPVPIVATPLFWDHRELWLASRVIGTAAAKSPNVAAFDEVWRRWQAGWLDVSRLADQVAADWAALLAFHAPALRAAACLLVSGEREAAALASFAGEAMPGYRVVPLGARPERFGRRGQVGHAGDRVLCVGRLEPRKNQLMLIRALREMDWPLTLAGPVGNEEYAALCRRWSGRRVTFLGDVPDDDLAGLYAGHGVHALPSWFELPGLVTFEAGMAGCGLVVGDRAVEPEVFAGLAQTCDPADWGTIAAAVARASLTESLAPQLQTRFTWSQSAQATAAVYREILGGA
jgi:glycosyltransferase involved in cell wall biosynthesis